MDGCSMCIPLMIALVLMVGVSNLAEAQNVQLSPCLDFMNATIPPNTCCDPVKETVATELACLCNLYTTAGVLESFGINLTRALGVTSRCGITTFDISECSKALASTPSTSVTPPAIPGRNASRVAGTGNFDTLAIL